VRTIKNQAGYSTTGGGCGDDPKLALRSNGYQAVKAAGPDESAFWIEVGVIRRQVLLRRAEPPGHHHL
jgi:hypothetical protein